MSTVASVLASEGPSRDSVLRAELDERACWEKVADTIASIWREFVFLIVMVFSGICGALCGGEEPSGLEIVRHSESRGLVVLVHGLWSPTQIWSGQLACLEGEPVDIFVPNVPEKGVCSLAAAVEPLYLVIRDYAQQNPQKRIFLAGHSNGSRIVSKIEADLRADAPESAVMVSTIAGVHFGSSRMNQVDDCGLCSCCYPAELSDEMRYGSDTAQELMDRLAAPLPEGCAPRAYEFFATPEDLLVPDLDSSFPLLNKGERYHLMPGHGHASIVAAVAEQQMRACLDWMNGSVA